MATIHLDYVTFALLEPHDFSWLRRLGAVFCVYPGQDSGNLLFGVERDGIRRFVKYAGARTTEYGGTPEEAVARLRRGLPGARPSRPDRDERGAGAAQWIRLRF